ncbi:hypothetical protein HK096_005657, partial [Nowakowskiella sp. JEL0078]
MHMISTRFHMKVTLIALLTIELNFFQAYAERIQQSKSDGEILDILNDARKKWKHQKMQISNE